MNPNQVDLKRLQIIRWIIYALVAMAVVFPYIVPLPLPFKASDEATRVYDKLDSLQPGDHVMLAFDYDPASEAELYPMSLALLRHCFKKGVIPVVTTHWTTGIGLAKKACDDAVADANSIWGKQMVSGEDYVFLGYRPGGANLVLKMGEDLKGAFEKDYAGQPTRGMNALEGVKTLKDFKLMVDLAAGASVEMWIAFGTDRAGIPMATGTTAVMAPDLYPFYQSKQLMGFLGGLRGAADYEKLLDISGKATRGMQAQSVTHVLIILLILGANFRMLFSRFFGKERD